MGGPEKIKVGVGGWVQSNASPTVLIILQGELKSHWEGG